MATVIEVDTPAMINSTVVKRIPFGTSFRVLRSQDGRVRIDSPLGEWVNSSAVVLQDEAIELFTRHIAVNPTATNYNRRGILHLNIGKSIELAISDYDTALSIDPEYYKAHQNRGYCHWTQKQYQQAIDRCESAIAINPACIAAIVCRERVWMEQGKLGKAEYEQTIAAHTHAISLDAKNENAYLERGNCWLRQDAFDKAIDDFKQAQEIAPENSVNWRHCGYAYWRKGDKSQALYHYGQSRRLNPYNELIYSERGQIQQEMQRHQEAVDDFDHAIQLNPDVSDYWTKRAFSLMYLEGYEKVLASYENAVRLDPENAEALNGRGFVHERLGNQKQAQADFQAAESLAPNNPGILYYLMKHYVATTPKEPSNALGAIQLGERICELTNWTYSTVVNELINAYCKVGQTDEALESLEKAIAQNNDNQSLYISWRGHIFYNQIENDERKQPKKWWPFS